MSSAERKRKSEQTSSSSSSHKKKGHGKGSSNTSRRHVQKKTKTEEQQQTVTQEHIYPTTVREVLNYRQSGRKEDVPDDLSWHTCDQGCTVLEEDNLVYKYLYQNVCTAHPSRWLLGFNFLGYTDWQATVIASKITPFHPAEERLKLVGKLSDKREDTTRVIKELETFAELETMYNELKKRVDIQQLVFEINNFLRVTVLQYKDCFYLEGRYAHCSIEIQQMNNRVRGISFYMLHVVFHMQLRMQEPDVKEWWISICNKKTMQDGYETMKVQVNHIFQEYLQNLVGEIELRSDGAGKKYNWTISRVEEVVTTKAEAPTQDETLKDQLSPVSEPTDGVVQHIHGSESEGEEET